MRISDWSSDVCSSDLAPQINLPRGVESRVEDRQLGAEPRHLADWQLAIFAEAVFGRYRRCGRLRKFAAEHCFAIGTRFAQPRRRFGEVLVAEDRRFDELGGERVVEVAPARAADLGTATRPRPIHAHSHGRVLATE